MSDDKSTVSECLGSAGAPLTIELRGKVFAARAFEQYVKSQWERFLRQDYRREALETTGSEAKADRMTTEAASRKQFRWLSPYSNEVAATPEGALVLTTLILGCTEDEAFALDREKGTELGGLLQQVIDESIPSHRRRKREDANGAVTDPTVTVRGAVRMSGG